MAIQMRRGAYADFDPTKMVPGEFAVVQEDDPNTDSGHALYLCYSAGDVERIVDANDLEDIIEQTTTIDWNNVTDKPSEFPTNWANISDHPAINAGTGTNSIREGATGNIASGSNSHAEGYYTKAEASYAHAEGNSSKVTSAGNGGHAEGANTTVSGNYGHSEGALTTASGERSHAEGFGTIANHASQHVFGEYNSEDTSSSASTSRGTYVEIVGNGTSSSNKSNARTLDWDGNETLAGKLTVGAGPTNNMDVTTKQYVDTAISGSHATYTDANNDGNIVISLS